MKIRLITALLVVCAILNIPFSASANTVAAELTAACTVTADGESARRITDGNIYTYITVNSVEISCDEKLFGLYVKFDKVPSPWILNANGTQRQEGEDGFLHSFIQLDGVNSIELYFENGAAIADIFLYGEGNIPAEVHRWEKAERADIMICPTHSDDDQLYFSGMIPWCVANGYTVQIVYLTNHNNTHDRPHELLEGLWHCGVKYYPIISEFPDIYSESYEQAVEEYEDEGYVFEDFIVFYNEAINEYKPLVVAGHDLNGEYGHGMHSLSFYALTKAVEASAENGDWDVPKTYIHLWEENAVVFDWDEPLEYFGGKSAFNVSQEGFEFHKSQHRFTGLVSWLYGSDGSPITKASEIRRYSPCKYGLYRSTVGYDSVTNGIFENLKSYGEQEAEAALLNHKKMLNKAAASLRADKDIPVQTAKLPIIFNYTEDNQSTEETWENTESINTITEEPTAKNNGIDKTLLMLLGGAVIAFVLHLMFRSRIKES